MGYDILSRITEKTRSAIANELGIDAELLNLNPPKDRNLDWYNAADDRDEARLVARYIAEKIGEPIEPPPV